MTAPWILAAISALTLFGCSGDEPTAPASPKKPATGAVQTAPAQQPAANPSAQHRKGHVVGKVGDHLITDQDIDAEFAHMPANFRHMQHNPAMRANILNNMLTRLALTEKAKRLGITDDPAVRGKIERARTSIILQELNRRQRSKLADLSDAKLRAYYQANLPRFRKPEQVHVRHILLKDAQLAKKLLRRLRHGADFAELAKKYSEDNSSKTRGGDIGSFARGRMAPPFEKAAFALKKAGDLAGPVKTRFGYHIIELIDRTPATTQPFAQVKARIKQELQQQAFRTWVEGVKRELGVTVVDPRYQRHGMIRREKP